MAGVLSRGTTTLVVALACGCANLTATPVEGTPAADESDPATMEGAPATMEGTPAAMEGTPAANESAPATMENPAEGYIEFMKRVAAADDQTRDRMRREIYRRSEDAPLTTRLQLGFLLTSPTETEANTKEGEKILRETLAGESGLHASLRDLIELRLREVEVRQALRVQLGEAKGKIADLLTIERSMEKKKTESQTRSR